MGFFAANLINELINGQDQLPSITALKIVAATLAVVGIVVGLSILSMPRITS